MQAIEQSIEQSNDIESQRVIFHFLEDCLRNPADSHQNATKIVEEFRAYLKAHSDDVSLAFWDLWMVLLDIVWVVPPDHPWQDTLVEMIQLLR